ncbi:MAG TPA: damage-control phosphatase ARMT1 family protein [Anaerolinea sp.]|nr:damage-control phosphatase ARMT1 family protein [Anaerolinea sp.]
MLPALPLPPAYLCSDPGSFAEHTLLIRLPEIARRMIAENQFPEPVLQRLHALLAEIPDVPVRAIDDPSAPDLALWEKNFQLWLGKPWHELSFLAAEKYFYRRILQATGYYQPGETNLLDPYQRQKDLGLEVSRTAVMNLVHQVEAWKTSHQPLSIRVAQAVESNLWGNRADLSILPAGGEQALSNEHLHQADGFLLVNDLGAAVEYFVESMPSPQAIHILADNAGYELVSDLALADLFLGSGLARQVTFHLKAHPTFVSDALIKDVSDTIIFLETHTDLAVREFGRRLANHQRVGRIVLRSYFFWNAPLAFWHMPEHVRKELGNAALVISKGDANYRRLTGDRRWPEDTSFSQVTSYFPAPLLALRVAKSDVMVGLQPGQVGQMDAREPKWRTNGRWGMIQFKL